jgi:hypothetical protein
MKEVMLYLEGQSAGEAAEDLKNFFAHLSPVNQEGQGLYSSWAKTFASRS